MNRARLSAVLFAVCTTASCWAQQYIISTIAGGAPPATPRPADQSSIGDPPRVAVDAAGNVYFGSIHSVFKVDREGILTRIAGTGRLGSSGDGGPAINAQFKLPFGIAVDAAGNVLVADRDAHVVRRISTNGTISTVAGTGVAGFSGDEGPATAARLNSPTGLALDTAGNLYIADSNNNVIRRVSPDGTITTVAGNTERGFAGDNGPAREADLSGPQGIAVDSAGNLYIADTLNNRIRRVGLDGMITTFAGNGFPGYGGDDGPATRATLFLPTDVVVDRQGSLYIADLGTIRVRLVKGGNITTAAGSTAGEPPFDGRHATSVRLSGPTGVAVSSDGILYFTESSLGSGSGLTAGDSRIWRVTPDGVLSTVAGTGESSFSGDGGPAVRAQLNVPAGITVDGAGNIYFADSANNRVRKISKEGEIVTVAGYGLPGFAGEQGPANVALLNQPTGVAVDSEGRIFISDTGNHRVRVVNAAGVIGTVAGNGNAAYFGDGSRAVDAALHSPGGIAVDAEGTLYIADTLTHRVRKVQHGIIDTVAGRGQGFGGDGGPAVQALLNSPTAVAVDAAGNLYIADSGNGRIRKVTPQGIITTVAGGGFFGAPSGVATELQFGEIKGVTVDRAGNFYFSESERVRKVTPAGILSTLAGNGECCYSNDGGDASIANLNSPWGLAVDSAGSILVADSQNHAIRAIRAAPAAGGAGAVTNAASNLPGPIAPGELVTIYASGLGPAQPARYQLNSSGLVGTQLAGVSVLFNGIFGPVLYASSTQITAVVPYGIAGTTAQIVAQYQGVITFSASLPLAAASPAFLTLDSSGRGQAVAINQDGTANGSANNGRPAPAGSTITLYATGEGQTSPTGIDGKPGAAPFPRPVLPVAVTIGGTQATVQFAGGAADAVAGVMLIRVEIPSGIAPGAVPIQLTVGGIASPPGVTIAVGSN